MGHMQFYLAITSFELGWKKQNKINTFDFPLLVKWDRLTILPHLLRHLISLRQHESSVTNLFTKDIATPRSSISLRKIMLTKWIFELGYWMVAVLPANQKLGRLLSTKMDFDVVSEKVPWGYLCNYWLNVYDKQRVLMHRHQGWNVRHGLCHIYMRYLYIYELFIAFVCFVVCSLL